MSSILRAIVCRRRLPTAGREHSPTHAAGTAWQPTPWRAVQGAALQTLVRAEAA